MSKSFVKFKNFIKDPDKKPYGQIAWEAVKCGFAERELPRHYFTRLLYKKGVDNYLDYMGVKKNNRLASSEVIHNHTMAPLLDNKLCFSMFMAGKPGVNIAKVLGFNFKNAFFRKGHCKPEMMNGPDDVIAFLLRLLDGRLGEVQGKTPGGVPEQTLGEILGETPGEAREESMGEAQREKVFIKPIDRGRGQHCFLLTRQDLLDYCYGEDVDHPIFQISPGEAVEVGEVGESKGSPLVSEIIPLLLQGSFLYQEVLEQHRDIAEIYPRSLNTMRIDTYLDRQGEVHLMTGLMRFGVNGRVVDNITTGGIFVPIDMETGRLKQKAFRLLEHGGNVYTEHPDTGFVFEDFEIPYFHEVREMLAEAVRLIPDILLGWDVAVTPEGPVIVEGSQQYSPRLSEMAYGGYKNHPIYKEILKGL